MLDVLAVQRQAAAIPGSPSAQQLLVNVPVPSSPLALLHIRILGSEASGLPGEELGPSSAASTGTAPLTASVVCGWAWGHRAMAQQ